jgi:hypothetical protein
MRQPDLDTLVGAGILLAIIFLIKYALENM